MDIIRSIVIVGCIILFYVYVNPKLYPWFARKYFEKRMELEKLKAKYEKQNPSNSKDKKKK